MKRYVNRIKGDIGRHSKHGSKIRPYVMLEIENDWLTPSEARRMAEKLLREADKASLKAKAYRASNGAKEGE